MDIRKETEEMKEYLVDLRRHFHMHPEGSLQEYETSRYIQNQLEAMGIAFRTAAGTGIIGTIGNKGNIIALRADMDGLPVWEKNQVDYCSRNGGMMHACGHDVHMAALLGAARLLKRHEKELKCQVRLIFQPGEEVCRGASLMIEAGALENVKQIFGLHVFADMPYGTVNIEEGARMAATDVFRITIQGKSGHAGKPHQCVDATVAAAALVMNLQSIVSRETDPVETVVVTIGSFHSGTTYNIISGEAVLEGTIRSFSPEAADRVKASINRTVEATAMTYRASAHVEYRKNTHPEVRNDPEVCKIALKGAKKVLPRQAFISRPKMMLGEDFSNYQRFVPGAFALVGGGDGAADMAYPNHHERFNVVEDTVLTAVMLHAAYVESYSESQNKQKGTPEKK